MFLFYNFKFSFGCHLRWWFNWSIKNVSWILNFIHLYIFKVPAGGQVGGGAQVLSAGLAGRHPHQHAQHGNRVPQPGTHPFLIGLNFGFFVKCKCTVVESAVWPDQCALVPFEACNSRLCKSTIFVGVSGGPSALSGRLKILSAVLDWQFLNFANLK